MQFLSRDQCTPLLRRKDVGRVDAGADVILYYASSRDWQRAAETIVAGLGDVSFALGLFDFAITGDGYGEAAHASDHWRAYRNWRATQGCRLRLYDGPGHLFGPGEAHLLRELFEHALTIGWDMRFAARPGSWAFRLSHDDRIEFVAGENRRALAARLEKLGWRPAAR